MQLTVEIRREGATYWSQVRELPGCLASGRSLEELREALGEAIGLCVRDRPVSIAEPLALGQMRIDVDVE